MAAGWPPVFLPTGGPAKLTVKVHRVVPCPRDMLPPMTRRLPILCSAILLPFAAIIVAAAEGPVSRDGIRIRAATTRPDSQPATTPEQWKVRVAARVVQEAGESYCELSVFNGERFVVTLPRHPGGVTVVYLSEAPDPPLGNQVPATAPALRKTRGRRRVSILAPRHNGEVSLGHLEGFIKRVSLGTLPAGRYELRVQISRDWKYGNPSPLVFEVGDGVDAGKQGS
jgi:hypothetical protein